MKKGLFFPVKDLACVSIQLFQHLSDPLEFLLNGNKQLVIFSVGPSLNQSQSHLSVFCPLLISYLLLRSSDGKTFFVKEFLDFQDKIEVLSSVKPLEGASLVRLDHLEFRLPIA